MAEKLSCRLTLFAAKGQAARMIASTAESEVTESFSRRRIGARRSSVCIKAARTAELLAPVTCTKHQISTMLKSAPRLPLPNRRPRSPTRKDICRPDTATTCMSPERLIAT